MKIRTGFVSNSSSSSFIVGVPKGTKISKELLMEAFGVPKESPLYTIAEDIANRISHFKKANLFKYENFNTIEEYIKEYPECPRTEILQKGFEVYEGCVSSDDPDDNILCFNIDYSNNMIVLKHDHEY